MNFGLLKKDVIALNQIFDTGTLINEPSLDFALGYARKTTNWPNALAFLVRAILLDHVFEEGNKRTAALLVKTYASMQSRNVNHSELNGMVKDILLKNISQIRSIEEMLNNVIK